MDIRKLYLFEHYPISVFDAIGGDNLYYTIKGGTVCYGHGKSNIDSVETEFANTKGMSYLPHHKMFSRVSELTEEKAHYLFELARYDSKDGYPSYLANSEEKISSALSSIQNYLYLSEGWKAPENKTWIIIPKPDKKMSGQKIDIEFNICTQDFKQMEVKTILPVYMTRITAKTTSVEFSVEIPDFLYNFLINHPEEGKRPTSRILTYSDFSALHGRMDNLCSDAINLTRLDTRLKNAQRVIVVAYYSSQGDVRDAYQFGYAGKKTNISYQFFCGYKIATGLFDNGAYDIFVDKRYEQGKGFVTTNGRLALVGGQKGKLIPWTQEREDYLSGIESHFKRLIDQLNFYLADLDELKLDALVANGLKELTSAGETV